MVQFCPITFGENEKFSLIGVDTNEHFLLSSFPLQQVKFLVYARKEKFSLNINA